QKTMQKLKDEEESTEERQQALLAEISELEKERDAIESDAAMLKKEHALDVQEQTIEAMDKFAKIKIQKLNEIEKYLEDYRNEKLAQIAHEMERQAVAEHKSLEDLQTLNRDYNRRAAELDDLAMTLESERKSLALKEKLLNQEQADQKNMLQSEMEFNTKEMTLLLEAKDQQIELMQGKLKIYTEELTEYREQESAAGKSKQELQEDIEYLRKQISTLQTELQSRPAESYLASLQEQLKSLESLESENRTLSSKVVTLENERHNRQIAVNEISRLTEQNAILEERVKQLQGA
ncbi:MAG: hypothetical protein FWG68_07700, partial [Defluviitaleaceae bacterium]|nr:hypothetical protein [Defluviitaleaceae bacterium]